MPTSPFDAAGALSLMYMTEQVPVRTLLVAHNAGRWQQLEHQPPAAVHCTEA